MTPHCHVCGCTNVPCMPPRSWFEPDLCSRCADAAIEIAAVLGVWASGLHQPRLMELLREALMRADTNLIMACTGLVPQHRLHLSEYASGRLVIEEVGHWYGLALSDITGPSRRRPNVRARCRVAHELRRRGWSFKRIGYVLGGRHQSAVRYWLKLPQPDPEAV